MASKAWRLDDDTLSWSDEFEPLVGIRVTQGVLRETFVQRVHAQDAARLGRGRLDLGFRTTMQGGGRILRQVGQALEQGGEGVWVMAAR